MKKMIRTQQQFIENIETFEHPEDDPAKKDAYDMAIDDILSFIDDVCDCFKEGN